MTIKESAARTGVSADTLRYYERMGIIPAVPRTSGGVRNYDENFVEWVAHIKILRAHGHYTRRTAHQRRRAQL